MKKLAMSLCMTVLAFGVCSGVVSAEDAEKKKKEGKNVGEQKAKLDDQYNAVQLVRAAHEMIDYGRKEKSPHALIAAAQVLAGIETAEMEGKIETTEGEEKDGSEAAPTQDNSPKQLLKQAKKLAGGDQAVATIVEREMDRLEERPRGAVPGPYARYGRSIAPHATDNHYMRFRGAERWCVWVNGVGASDLDVHVFDEHNNPISSDTRYGDRCLVEGVPNWTGPFRVEVRNLGSSWNRYDIYSN